MPKHKKKFIDKKNSVTFQLVDRSQRDPLICDNEAPQKLLMPVDVSQAPKVNKHVDPEIQKRKKKEQEFGIYFDDDYDYLQHLKESQKSAPEWERIENTPNQDKREAKQNLKANIKLPSSVFASDVQEKVGVLMKDVPMRGPRPDLDPDIVATWDDDYKFDENDEFEDDFFVKANAAPEDEDMYEPSEEEFSDEERDEVGSLDGPQYTFKEEETKSRFTEYSMSSSVMRRNNQLLLLDDKFEKAFEDYSDTEIGALDCEEIEGYMAPDCDMLLQYADEFEKSKDEGNENLRKLMQERLKIINERDSSSDDEEDLVVKPRDPTENWDCQTILSTYSNIYNHPKLISEKKKPEKIKIDPRTGIPRNVLFGQNENKLTAQNLAKLNVSYTVNNVGRPMSVAETMKSALSILSIRPKDETPEERRERKKKYKEYRKERILEKKANTNAFKEEKKRQEKIKLNQRPCIQGSHML